MMRSDNLNWYDPGDYTEMTALYLNNSANVSENTITEIKDEYHKETSSTKKATSCFKIFKCRMNLLYRLEVMYQRAFMATPEDYYYKEMLKSLIRVNNNEGEPLCNEKLRQPDIDIR